VLEEFPDYHYATIVVRHSISGVREVVILAEQPVLKRSLNKLSILSIKPPEAFIISKP
jgi:hypothetical protein